MAGAPPIGLLPAAGRGRRLSTWWASKELYPVLVDQADGPIPVPVCRFALDAMRRAGATEALVVLSEDKGEVVRVLGDGGRAGLSLAYAVQPSPDGLPGAVRAAAPWLGDRDVVLALPDTVFTPRSALAELHAVLSAHRADLVLGVFPTDQPERLAPVRLDGDRVLAIQDKPAQPVARNTWGAVAWSPRFTGFCADWDADRAGGDERTLSAAMEAARAAGLDVRARAFSTGQFVDAGTPGGLAAVQRWVGATSLDQTGWLIDPQ